jgi:hypothetical protein
VQHRLALAAEQKKVEELQKQQALDASNAARAEALRCAKEAEKRRQEELIEKQKADEQRMKEMKEARAREHAIKQEMLRLSKQDKLDAVERLRRQDEVFFIQFAYFEMNPYFCSSNWKRPGER